MDNNMILRLLKSPSLEDNLLGIAYTEDMTYEEVYRLINGTVYRRCGDECFDVRIINKYVLWMLGRAAILISES